MNQTLLGWLMVVGLANGCVAAEETAMFRADPAHSGVYLTAAPQYMFGSTDGTLYAVGR